MLDFGSFFSVRNMDIAAKQRAVIKYCVCHGKMVIETLSKLKETYGDECMAKSTVLKRHAIFVKDLSAALAEFEKTIKVK